ncbi:MAG: hypothetical protein AAFO04_11130 [Cyanobacteria bacterium J06592_8]
MGQCSPTVSVIVQSTCTSMIEGRMIESRLQKTRWNAIATLPDPTRVDFGKI